MKKYERAKFIFYFYFSLNSEDPFWSLKFSHFVHVVSFKSILVFNFYILHFGLLKHNGFSMLSIVFIETKM